MIHASRVSLATSAAIAALVAAAVVFPASAQTKTYPEGTDCTKLVGNDKTDCANQAKMTGSPDNSNNPDNAAINTSNGNSATGASGTTMPAANSTKNYEGMDCTTLVGNDKAECASQNKQTGVPDNSNNPDNADINPTKNGTAAPATTENSSDTKKNYKGMDCSTLVGNDKTECANQNKMDGEKDDSNNPAKSDPAQSN
jgi:hypothetical protein